ncbi:hypothetical protein [Chryseobacterium sp. Marseille-Q3244]|uniref:hypothetical protein n=1 Tax=Chryseobacterium sp. Marseille-Q3244 TaxID=2758092 RepID=UPI00202584A0|nr:hypothetical protein [Chryseobacterium sp. Marseille-Q3244]
MVTERVKHIFYFIDFLHSNIENFNKQERLLDEIAELRKIYNDLDPKTNFEHKFERERIAEKGNKLIGIFHRECKNTINEKINELEITDIPNIGNDHFYHIGEFIILVETRKYDKEDVKLIIEAKEKYVSILENLKLSLDNFLPYGLAKDFNEILLDCFKPFLSLDDKLKINKSKEIQFNRHMVTIESLDIQGIRNAVNKLTGKSFEFEFDINNWLINDKNIFEFSQDISLPLLTIQAEILEQCKAQNTSKLNDFLKSEINISKLISGTNELSIEKIFKDYLDLNIGSPELETPMTVNVNILLGYLKIELFRIYLENINNLFLQTERYKEKFQSLQDEFINSNIDVDKIDFIKSELEKCKSLLKELEKPVYNEMSILGDTENEPCRFKKQFLNTLDKRQSFLNSKLEEFKNLSESQKYEQSIRVSRDVTEEDLEKNPFFKQIGIKEGDTCSQIPEPKNREEAIERLKKYDAQKRFEYLKEIFSQKYGNSINVKIIEDELKPIYKFIEEANKLSTLDAFENKDTSDYLEYLRLANRYYENANLPYYSYHTYFNYGQKNNSLLTYAKYFLYKIWLEEKREVYTKKNTQTIGYFSIPYDFNIDDDWDTRKKKCEMHNQSIYRRYEKNLKNGEEQLLDLVSKMLSATEKPLQTSEYDLLERQFNQIKSICSIALNSKIDKGCVIEGVGSSLIENKFTELQEFHKKSIVDIDIHLKTLEGLKKRDLDRNYNSKQTEQLKTKAQILSESLYEYGFFELEKLKQLSEKNQKILIQLISENKLPYIVAMLDYLNYFSYLEKNHFTNKSKLYSEVAKWFNCAKDGRTIKGNVYSLLKNSTENKKRYTAFKHKEKVIKDYEELK